MLLVNKLEAAVSISLIMHCHSLSMHIFSHTPHLNSVRSEETTSVTEIAAREAYWVVSLGDNEHSHDLFISVYNEVASEFVHVFMSSS